MGIDSNRKYENKFLPIFRSLSSKTIYVCKVLPVHNILLSFILIFSGYLIFKNLGDASLWIDEAATAIIAKNFSKTGHFTGWDGRNLFALRNGAAVEKNLNDPSPPMQFLLTAASFSFFGESNFSARLAMAIIGLLTVILLYWYLRTDFPDHPAIALYGAAFLGLLPEFILYTRNCRYYAVTAFAALLTFIAYRYFLKRFDLKSALCLASAAILLFYSHFQICAAFIIPLILSLLLFEKRQLQKKHWLYLLLGFSLFATAILPYTLINRVWERPDLPNTQLLNRFSAIWFFIRDGLGTGIAPWSILVASTILMLIWQINTKTRHIVKSVLFIIVAHIVFVAFTSLQDIPEKFPIANVRYLVACFPFTAILAALVLYRIHQKNKIIAIAITVILISSNLSYVFPGQNQRYKFKHPLIYFPFLEYLQEIHHPYQTATGAVSAFLKSNAGQDETYYSIPEYTDDPLKFYVGSKLINCCILNKDTYLGAEKMKLLSSHLLIDENFPDWLIFFGRLKIKTEQNSLRYFSRPFYRQDAPDVSFNYDYALVKTFDIYWGQTNRPEIFLHNFGTVNRIIPNESVVLIYRKVKDDPANWLLHFPLILYGAQIWAEHEILMRALQKFYGIYLHDSNLVNKNYSPEEILGYFKMYSRLLLEEKRYEDMKEVFKTISQFEPR